jgi:hypothetical protein
MSRRTALAAGLFFVVERRRDMMRPCALAAATMMLWPLTARADDRWQPFDESLVKSCDGDVVTVATGRVKVSKIGQVMGVPSDPPCGDENKPRDPTWVFSWDDQKGVGVTVFMPGGKEANCNSVVVAIPEDAAVCEIRYYKSNSKGKGFKEIAALRNKGKAKDFAWAKKGATETRVRKGKREFRALFKNWRRSYSRYFGVEIDVQQRQTSTH